MPSPRADRKNQAGHRLCEKGISLPGMAGPSHTVKGDEALVLSIAEY